MTQGPHPNPFPRPAPPLLQPPQPASRRAHAAGRFRSAQRIRDHRASVRTWRGAADTTAAPPPPPGSVAAADPKAGAHRSSRPFPQQSAASPNRVRTGNFASKMSPRRHSGRKPPPRRR